MGEEIVAEFAPRGVERFRVRSDDTLRIVPDDARDAALQWNAKSWRGTLLVFATAGGGLTLASELPLETYLLGVVPGEIGALSETLVEAGRAQAIAARSYTLFYLGRRAAEGFDLYGTVEDQVYGPLESERPLATRCVSGTRGVIALADGRPIRANYCSTCGGITAEVWEAWPQAALGYLVSHRDRDAAADYCAGSPHYRWTETWSAGEFVRNVETFGRTRGLDPRLGARRARGRAGRGALEERTRVAAARRRDARLGDRARARPARDAAAPAAPRVHPALDALQARRAARPGERPGDRRRRLGRGERPRRGALSDGSAWHGEGREARRGDRPALLRRREARDALLIP